jgi:hypothetical protein
VLEHHPSVERRSCVCACAPIRAQLSRERQPEATSTALLPDPGFLIPRFALVVASVEVFDPTPVNRASVTQSASCQDSKDRVQRSHQWRDLTGGIGALHRARTDSPTRVTAYVSAVSAGPFAGSACA